MSLYTYFLFLYCYNKGKYNITYLGINIFLINDLNLNKIKWKASSNLCFKNHKCGEIFQRKFWIAFIQHWVDKAKLYMSYWSITTLEDGDDEISLLISSYPSILSCNAQKTLSEALKYWNLITLYYELWDGLLINLGITLKKFCLFYKVL